MKFDADGWAVYKSETPPDLWLGQLKALSDAAAHDCRGFVSVSRKAKLDELWRQFSPSWEDFCRDHLERTPEFIEAMLVGAEALGHKRPFSDKEAVTAAQRGQEAAKATSKDTAPTKQGQRSDLQPAQITQVKKAEESGVSRRHQQKLDALARSRPDLLEAVRAGIMSAHCAAVEAGIVKAVWSAPVDEDDLERALKKRYPGWRIVRVAP